MQVCFHRPLIFLTAISILLSCSPSKKTSTASDKYAALDSLFAQTIKGKKEYQSSAKRENDLLHTKLEVKFDWAKEQLNGKATLTFKPYFYPTSNLTLDAKSFDIHQIALLKKDSLVPLEYTYDTLQLHIALNKEYTRNDTFKIFIDYTAKPNEVKQNGSDAISSAKGLYFVNADGKEKYKPRQIWTQGETESNSCWFPTIDKPNEKTTDEIYITVDTNFVTLSNGSFGYSSYNKDGTRTDYWKMDLPHAPYLMMMAIGEYAVVKDKWRDIEVNYYVEKEYKDDAKAIFGNTPEMLEFFSKKLGVDYPWQKYSQVIVRDYVSGAMENTTATIHGEFVQRTKRELIDGNEDDIIAHELFHQWFGDLVTCESWANLPLNESFADYGEYLWNEHKYGKEEADYGGYNSLKGYLQEAKSKKEHLIRYYYDANDKEKLFDAHSYNKGGRVLHLLRNYVGDEAFFKSLQLYLNTNKFKSAEIHHLRLAFEEITGEDLNWFFNQWFLSAGHPKLEIEYIRGQSANMGEHNKMACVKIKQAQDISESTIFCLPMAIDFYVNGKVERNKVVMKEKEQTFCFQVDTFPNLINVDADKILLCEKEDRKSAENFAFQFHNAPLFMDKMEALNYFGKKLDTELAKEIFTHALNAQFWAIRDKAIEKLDFEKMDSAFKARIKPLLIDLAKNDKKSAVRGSAIAKIGEYENKEDLPLFVNAVNDSSYEIIAMAMDEIKSIDTAEALNLVKKFENDKSADMLLMLTDIYSTQSDVKYAATFERAFEKLSGFYKYPLIMSFGNYLLNVEDENILDKGLELLNKEALDNSQHWIRKTAESVIAKLKTKTEENRDTLKLKLDNTDKIAPEHSTLQTQLEKLNSRIESIDKMLQHIKEKQKKS